MTANASCLPETSKKTVVVGVGGVGCRAISVLAKTDLPGVRLIAVDTDWTSVRLADVHRRVELRHASIYIHGSGGNQGWAQRCAEVCSDELREALSDPSFVLIVAGMGGGTGVGASPVIARLAAESGAPVAAVVTLPAQWEGPRRNDHAKEGLDVLYVVVVGSLNIPKSADDIRLSGSIETISSAIRTSNKKYDGRK